MLIWILIIAIVSVLWALVSLKKERNKREIIDAKNEISKGRVIFHSSDISDSSS